MTIPRSPVPPCWCPTHFRCLCNGGEGTSQQELDAMPFSKHGIRPMQVASARSPTNQVRSRLFHYMYLVSKSESKSYHAHPSGYTTAQESGLCITVAEERDAALLYTDGRLHGSKIVLVRLQSGMMEKIYNQHNVRGFMRSYRRLAACASVTSDAARRGKEWALGLLLCEGQPQRRWI